KGFNDIYNNLLTDYKTPKFNSGDFKEAIRKRLDLRNRIYNVLTQNYKNNKQLARHFYHKDLPVPIWAIFEMLCLGEFGTFVACLNLECRKKISQSLGLNQSCDTEAKLTKTIIFTIKDLRNAIAHNDVIFDARFKEGKVGNQLLKCLEYDTKVTNITFETIVDYLVLVVYLLKKFQVPFTELRRLILNFQGILETLRKQIPISVYSRIIYTDTRNKLSVLKEFI
ncbi:MAG: Abi family protein, partial [Bacillota bacterium]